MLCFYTILHNFKRFYRKVRKEERFFMKKKFALILTMLFSVFSLFFVFSTGAAAVSIRDNQVPLADIDFDEIENTQVDNPKTGDDILFFVLGTISLPVIAAGLRKK